MEVINETPKIYFKSGYKYQLMHQAIFLTEIYSRAPAKSDFIGLELDGTLTIRAGYAWDGASGPALDSLNFMRGSLAHDALYQLIREGQLPIEYRDKADRELQRICIEDGMTKIRAWYVYQAVKAFGKQNAKPGMRKLLVAP